MMPSLWPGVSTGVELGDSPIDAAVSLAAVFRPVMTTLITLFCFRSMFYIPGSQVNSSPLYPVISMALFASVSW